MVEGSRLARIGGRRATAPWQRNMWVVVLGEGIALLGFGITVPFLPFYIQELGVSGLSETAFWVGAINSATPIAMAVASPLWGLIADRYGRKPMLVRSLAGGGVALCLMAAAADAWQLAALRVVQGFLAGSVPAATTLVAASTPRERCGYALGMLQTAIFAGNALGPLVGGVVAGTLGYRAAFVSSGVLLFAAGALVLLLVREEKPQPQAREKSRGSASWRWVLGQPALLAMLAMLALNSFCGMVTTPMLPLYVQTLIPGAQAAAAATGMLVGATAIANAVAAVAMGRSADRLGRRRVLLTCVAVGSLLYLPQGLTRSLGALLLLRILTGLAMGGVIPVANAIIAEGTAQGRQGSVYGLSAGLNALGRALGPVLGTVVVTQVGLPAGFPVTGALLGFSVLAVGVGTRGGAVRPDRAMPTRQS